MSRESNLPGYSLLSEADPPLAPPVRSVGLVDWYFPILADMRQLRAFCDNYVNFASPLHSSRIPAEAGHFSPVLPYVFLIVSNHPRVEVNDGTRWFEQRELTFAFIVEWYQKKKSQWTFRDWLLLVPFIYLDSPLGLTTGREIQGWPKRLATFDFASAQTGGLNDASHSVRVSAPVSDWVDGSARLETRSLIEVVRRQRAWPLDWIGSWGMLSESAIATWTALGVGGPADSQRDSAGIQFEKARQLITEIREQGIVTLKQFRDSEKPEAACYQALVYSSTRVERIRGGGLIGTTARLAGDVSGGYEIKIHGAESQPIVDLLGLRATRDSSARTAMLRPIAPFWLELDLTYGDKEVICERTANERWTTNGAGHASDSEALNPYNGARGLATECLSGALEYPDVMLRIIRVKGNPDAVEELRGTYGLGPPQAGRQATAEHDVYIVVASGEQRVQAAASLTWRFMSLGLYLPVSHAGKTAFISPLELVDNADTAIIGREREGRAIWVSEFSGAWCDRGDGSTLVRVRTQELADARGQPPTEPLFEVREAANTPRRVSRPLFKAPLSLTGVHLKQYRDAVDPTRAVYQKVTNSVVQVTGILEAGLLPYVHVRVADSSMFSVASALLGTNPIEPVSAQWMRASIIVHAAR